MPRLRKDSGEEVHSMLKRLVVILATAVLMGSAVLGVAACRGGQKTTPARVTTPAVPRATPTPTPRR